MRTASLIGMMVAALAPAPAEDDAPVGPPAPPAPRVMPTGKGWERPVRDVSRWNVRTTPRRMLETFFFAVYAYDLEPKLILNAIDCLDVSAIDPSLRERDAALIAHELTAILSRQDIPLYGVPDRPDGHKYTLVDQNGVKAELERGPDGLWRFDAATVARVPAMREVSYRNQRELQKARSGMAEGRTDPESTMRMFLGSIVRHDYTAAASCLDLRDVPPKLRAMRGPEEARKLAFVIQRCGFAFPHEFPSDPDGFRYVWYSNHRGRIMLERTRDSAGRDAWLFGRMTLRNLDALVEGYRETPPDPRYAFIGIEVTADSLAGGNAGNHVAPAEVPAAQASPRAALRTFSEAMDELDDEDMAGPAAVACLDLGDIPAADRPALGLRIAAKLEPVLRRHKVDPLCVSDAWDAEPAVFGRDTEWQVGMSRGTDGAWRFDRDTVARSSEMFDRLTREEKASGDHRSPFGSPRQALRTLLAAARRGDAAAAAQALDLDGLPAAARAEAGPVLAVKLAAALERVGRVAVAEVPDEPDGPRYSYFRGPIGRVEIARTESGPRQGEWLFTDETVAGIERLSRAVLTKPVSPVLAGRGRARVVTTGGLWALWVRSHLPHWAQADALGMEVYQWLGISVAVLAAAAASGGLMALANRLVGTALRRAAVQLTPEFVAGTLRPLGWQVGFWVVLGLLRLLDLPLGLLTVVLPAVKLVWVALLTWSALRLTDLGMAVYARSEHLNVRRNLSDMIVPTAARAWKLGLVLFALAYEVYLVGNTESLTRLLAGLGLVGLAASLAAQDTLKNVFGTLLLIGEHPFRIGDLVVIDGKEGQVEGVGFRSTRLRTPEDSLLTLPNSLIAATAIDNRGARTARRVRTMIAVAYGTPPVQVSALRDAIRDFARAHPLVRHDKLDVHIAGLNSNSIELLINLYVRASSYTEEMGFRDELSRTVLDHADRLGVEIALNTPPQPVTVSLLADHGHDAPPTHHLGGRKHRAAPRPRQEARRGHATEE